MVDIFDEVEEDLRAERTRQLLMRYGGVMVAAAVAVVIAAAAWQGWRWYQARQDMAAARIFMQGYQAATPSPATGLPADRAAAIAAFAKSAASGPEGYRVLSRLWEAALKADGGDPKGAAALWQQVADDGSADPLLRDYARLMGIARQIDSGDPGQLAMQLKPLAEATSPWHALAQEALALLDIRRGDDKSAIAALKALAADATAPDGVRGRANTLLARLGADTAQ